jgi:hypothetical protein
LRRFDRKYVLLFLFICIAAWFFSEHPVPLRKAVLTFVGLPKLAYWSWLFAAIVLVVYKLKARQLRIQAIMSIDEFRSGFEELFSFRSNPLTFGCSVAFTKALILQYFSIGVYFVNFTETELVFLAILTAYSLFVSTFDVVKRLIEIFMQPKAEAAKASTGIEPGQETIDAAGTAAQEFLGKGNRER